MGTRAIINYQKRLIYIGLCISLLFSSSLQASPATVSAARIAKQKNTSKFVFVLNKPVKYKYFKLTNPDRIVLDIRADKLNTDLTKLALKGTPVKTIRIGHSAEYIRLVFDLNRKATTRAYLLEPELHYRDRLVLEMTTQSSLTKNAKPAKKSQVVPIVDNDVPLKQASSRDIVVVIDPGHGGKDPGAIGAKGTREKDVVLSIAKDLYQLMRREPGLKPVLTRSRDRFVNLRGRLDKARDAKADMFVSIHADAYRSRSARGASVYALSQRGASSEAARWLAQKENHSELGGVDLNGLNSSDQTLRSVLIDLSQTATIAQSLNIGSSVLQQLGHLNTLHHNHVGQARFVVLKSPDIPSILVETGFLSNLSEERNLRDSVYRKRIARAVLSGIKQYFFEHPPRGTLYAAKQKQRLTERKREIAYRVIKGDTLSLIAERYHVSMQAIRERNKLKGDQLRVGQKLILPTNSNNA